MKIVMKSDIGNTRDINQDNMDYVILDDSNAMAVLCDGMGGHLAGEVASKDTVKLVVDKYKQGELPENMIESWMKTVILEADQKVTLDSLTHAEHEGMGTTIVLACIKDHVLHLSNIGDSRAYLFDKDRLVQLTVDHTLVNALVQNGTISENEAQYHPQRNILLQAIGGGSKLVIPYSKYDLSDELVLLCSDGLYNSLSPSQILSILQEDTSLEDKVDKLKKHSLLHGGFDNMSIILISLGD